MKIAFLVVVTLVLFYSQLTLAEDPRPVWITDEQLAALRKIGIDPTGDLEVKANYNWRYRANNNLDVDVYSCPIGSIVLVSRTIILIIAPKETPCNGSKGGNFGSLKLLPNGSAQPLS